MIEARETLPPKPTFFGSISTEKRWLLFAVLPLSTLVYVVLVTLLAKSPNTVKVLDIGYIFLQNLVVFVWCGVDSRERGYKLHRLFGFAVIVLGLLALAYYLFRSRGFRGGLASVGWLLVYFVCSYVIVLLVALVILVGLVASGLVPSSVLS